MLTPRVSVVTEPSAPRPRRVIAIFADGLGRMPSGSVSFLAGEDHMAVNDVVDELTRLDKKFEEARVRKIVPVADRDDRLDVGDFRFLLGAPNRRLFAKVLSPQGAIPSKQVDAVVAFVSDCLAAWAYDQVSRPMLLIVELDDFCELVGVAALHELIDRLQTTAKQFDVAILAIANKAVHQLVAALRGPPSDWGDAKAPLTVPIEATSDADSGNDVPPRQSSAANAEVAPPPSRTRTRNPHAQEIILQTLVNAGEPMSPKALAERLCGRAPTKAEHANYRKHLSTMKAKGLVEAINHQYQPSRRSADQRKRH